MSKPSIHKQARFALVTGDIGSGKTTVAGRVVERARQQGLSVAGLWCPARLVAGIKTGIEAVDLTRDERRLLAARNDLEGEKELLLTRPGPHTGRYTFDPEILAWANRVLAGAAAARPDLLMVDEIGPLELERGEGLAPVLLDLADGSVPRALLVVRERLLENLKARLDIAASTAVFLVEQDTRETLPEKILTWLFKSSEKR